MANYQSIKIEKGPGGFGGPLVITPTPDKNKIVNITGGPISEVGARIAELTVGKL